jgi:O-antigen ligase
MLNKKVDNYLNVFGFFLGYPCFYILDSSFTFFLFLLIVIHLPKDSFVGFIKVNNLGKKAVALFTITAFLSLLFAPWYDIELTVKPFKLFIQLIYWNFLVFFIIEFFETIKWKDFFGYILVGIILQIITFYLVKNLKIDLLLGYILIADERGRNSFVYQILALTPLILYFVLNNKKYTRYYQLTKFGAIISTLFTNGRAGTLIIISQVILFSFRKTVFKTGSFIIAVIVILGILKFYETQVEQTLSNLSDKIEPYNPRLALFLKGEAEGTDLSDDRSLLERQIHIQKGFMIFEKYPLLGVGFGNYGNYSVDLDNHLKSEEFERLSFYSSEQLNVRSAHNSYIQILSETGIIGLIFFIYILLLILIKLYTRGVMNNFEAAVFLSILGISIHLFAITGAYGAITFFVIGIGLACVQKRRIPT